MVGGEYIYGLPCFLGILGHDIQLSVIYRMLKSMESFNLSETVIAYIGNRFEL